MRWQSQDRLIVLLTGTFENLKSQEFLMFWFWCRPRGTSLELATEDWHELVTMACMLAQVCQHDQVDLNGPYIISNEQDTC